MKGWTNLISTSGAHIPLRFALNKQNAASPSASVRLSSRRSLRAGSSKGATSAYRVIIKKTIGPFWGRFFRRDL